MKRAEEMAAAVTRIEEEFAEILRPFITKCVYYYEGNLDFLHAENILWSYGAGMVLILAVLLCLVWHRKRIGECLKTFSKTTLYPCLLRLCTEISLASYRLRGRMPSSQKEQQRLRMRIYRMLEEESDV